MSDPDLLVGESIALADGETLFEQPETMQWEDATDCVARAARAQAWALVTAARAAGLKPGDVSFGVEVEVLRADGEELPDMPEPGGTA